MNDQEKIEQSAALFRSMIEREPEAAFKGDSGAASDATQITTPHPYYVMDGRAVLNGSFAGAEVMAGYQSLVLRGEEPVEVLIAAPSGEEMQYSAAWPARVAAAFVAAMRVAQDNGIEDDDFVVATVPEVGLTALWFRERRAIVPLSINPANPGALDWKRVYTESEVVEHLRAPLRARFEHTTTERSVGKASKPPRA